VGDDAGADAVADGIIADVDGGNDASQDTEDSATEPDGGDVDALVDAVLDGDAALVPDTDNDNDTDTDGEPLATCDDLDCAEEGRECDEASDGAAAECGACLSTFIEDGDACVAPECTGNETCVPSPAVGEWSECGNYADVCATDGTRTRLVYEGACVGGSCLVTSSESAEPCPEPRVTDGVECVLGEDDGVCGSGACVVAPDAPASVSAGDGTSSEYVRVSWDAVDGAAGYNVYRDGLLITPDPLTTFEFEDTGAVAGGVPEVVVDVSATGDTDSITVDWAAASAAGPVGSAAEYTVAAMNVAGEGAVSVGDNGFRGGLPFTGYEVRIDAAGEWISAGSANTYTDSNALAGSIRVIELSASDGGSAMYVSLSATVSTQAGAGRSYEVRAVNAAGAGAESSAAMSQRTVGTTALQWQRSSGVLASDFADIAGAVSATFDDVGAPPDASVRYYQLVVTADGASTAVSSSDSGFRALALGDACSLDDQCGSDAWCNAVEGLRRCSPRLFAGQPHELDFAFIPAGTFEQGTPGSTGDDRPYTATLTRNYYVGRTEVTQAQWRAATEGLNPSCFQSTTGVSCSTLDENDSGPVERVDWYAALAYTNWLSRQDDLQECYTLNGCTDPTTGWYDGRHSGCTDASFVGQGCAGYRLLTESEWERAARGGATSFTTFYWGDAFDEATLDRYSWQSYNSERRSHPVAQKEMNAYGLFDMAGNVWEWVWDGVGPYPTEPATDFIYLPTNTFRGYRGGSWDFSPFVMASAYRYGNVFDDRQTSLGLRVARTAP
jgi:formylglycine-generating enzyme required for sulfatase activity